MEQTTHEIILSYMKLSGNSKQVAYVQLREAMNISWYKLFKKTKESVVRKWMPIVNGKISYPSTAENILGVYTVDECQELAPLYEDNAKNVLPMPSEKCSCTECDRLECMCPSLTDSISLIDVEYDQIYTNKIYTRVLKSGEIVEDKETWTPRYDNDGQFVDVVMIPSQRNIDKVDVKSCGCPIESEANAEKLSSCGCIQDCVPYLRYRYPAIYNRFGYYKKDDSTKRIHIFDKHGKKTKLLQAIVVFQSNGEDMLVPEYAKPALIACLNWYKLMYSPMYSYNDEIRAKRNFKREKNEMIKFLNPIPFEKIVHGDNGRTRSEIDFQRHEEINYEVVKPKVVVETQKTITQVINTTIYKEEEFDSISTVVGGGAGQPVQGLNTWQSNKLIGSIGIDYILVGKNNEAVNEDFTIDSGTGILTRNNAWNNGESLIIPLFKKIN